MLWVYKEIHFSIKINQAQIHSGARKTLQFSQLNNPQQLSVQSRCYCFAFMSDCLLIEK